MKHLTQKISAVGLITVIVCSFFATFVVAVPEVSAGVPYFVSEVVVSNPKPANVRSYLPGEVINFRADFIWTYCSNKGSGSIKGRISKPVAAGKKHTAFGGWSAGHGGKEVKQSGTVKIGTKKGGEKVQIKKPQVGIFEPRAASYKKTFRAPQKPGRYHFKYEMVIQTPQGDLHRSGNVTFKVEEPKRRCPANSLAVTQGGVDSCVPITLDMTCSASDTKIEPGESVTFSAQTSVPASFTWYQGVGIGGTKIAGPETGTESSVTQTYNTPGIYQVTAYAVDASRNVGMCTRGVTVGDVDVDLEDDESIVDEFGNIITETTVTTRDGDEFTLDGTAPAASITFEFDKVITNATCKGTWVAQNVLQCYLVANRDVDNAATIPLSDNEDLEPGTYQVQCVSLKDGSTAKSEERACRRNPEVREF